MVDTENDRCEEKTGWEVPGKYNRSEICCLQRALRYVIERMPTRKNDVAVIGSAALYWYQIASNIGPVWDDGPNDIDVFVAGKTGRSRSNFGRFVKGCISRLEDSGREILDSKLFFNTYVIEGKRVAIHNIKVKDFPQQISFIQCPTDDSVREVASRFDISVCKVIYHIHKCKYEMTADVMEDIMDGKARMERNFKFAKAGNPSRFEMTRIKRSMNRMRKYTKRGFDFYNGHGVTFA